MCQTPKTLVLAGLGIQWDCPAFCQSFLGDAEPVMRICDNPLQSSYGIRWCPEASHFLTNGMGGALGASADWLEVYAYSGTDPEGALALGAICARFARYDGVLAHGAAVDHQGQGILFVGPSGIGKTTQGELWAKYMDAEIINGDKALLRRFPDGVMRVCGLPWKGSSPYCLNRDVPLKAVVALRQSVENRIRRLTELECMEYFLPHVFLPHWDADAMDPALETVSRLIAQIPVYLLECRPDEAAVKLTSKSIF